MRHAKSAWPEVDDHSRPLAPRGRRDAPAAGRWLREARIVPDRVVCSTALRTRETWDLAGSELGAEQAVLYDRRLYEASADEVLAVVRGTPDEVRTLLIIGHNPAMQEVTLTLAGDAVDDARDQVRVAFPTAAIAVLSCPQRWSALAPGCALLTAIAVPRGAKR
ncbi:MULTISPECIES: histidine phosphatase family protein [unclassified Frankia]|uniref:SixA phosphatase family protein n=1 Tax=unclassified Frankia TaxID=2632575 RepID=UPI001931F5D9|nr:MULTISPECIES: histidine phosphatase family protein [unclassified Frankia]MBL7617937.1 histidine phosphatase family protein [Frankia sp. AgB1.8]